MSIRSYPVIGFYFEMTSYLLLSHLKFEAAESVKSLKICIEFNSVYFLKGMYYELYTILNPIRPRFLGGIKSPEEGGRLQKTTPLKTLF